MLRIQIVLYCAAACVHGYARSTSADGGALDKPKGTSVHLQLADGREEQRPSNVTVVTYSTPKWPGVRADDLRQDPQSARADTQVAALEKSAHERNVDWNKQLAGDIFGESDVIGPLVKCAFNCAGAGDVGAAIREVSLKVAQITVRAVAMKVPVIGPVLGQVLSQILGVLLGRSPADEPDSVTTEQLQELEDRLRNEFRTLLRQALDDFLMNEFTAATRRIVNQYKDYMMAAAKFVSSQDDHNDQGLSDFCGDRDTDLNALRDGVNTLATRASTHWPNIMNNTLVARFTFERLGTVVSAYTAAYVHFSTMCFDPDTPSRRHREIRGRFARDRNDIERYFRRFYTDYDYNLPNNLKFDWSRRSPGYCTRQQQQLDAQCRIPGPTQCANNQWRNCGDCRMRGSTISAICNTNPNRGEPNRCCEVWRDRRDNRPECGGGRAGWSRRQNPRGNVDTHSGTQTRRGAWQLRLCEGRQANGDVVCQGDRQDNPTLANVWQDVRGFNEDSWFVTIGDRADRNFHSTQPPVRRRGIHCGSSEDPSRRINHNYPIEVQTLRQFGFLKELAVSTAQANAIVAMQPIEAMSDALNINEERKPLVESWRHFTIGPVSFAAVAGDGLDASLSTMEDRVFIGGDMLDRGWPRVGVHRSAGARPYFSLGSCARASNGNPSQHGPCVTHLLDDLPKRCQNGVGAILVTFGGRPLWQAPPNTPVNQQMRGPHHPVNAILMYGNKKGTIEPETSTVPSIPPGIDPLPSIEPGIDPLPCYTFYGPGSEGIHTEGGRCECTSTAPTDCNCAFRDTIGSCQSQGVCQWQPNGGSCGCTDDAPESCRCAHRGSYNDCTSQSECEWRHEQPERWGQYVPSTHTIESFSYRLDQLTGSMEMVEFELVQRGRCTNRASAPSKTTCAAYTSDGQETCEEQANCQWSP